MVPVDIAMQYGVVGVALAFFYLMFMAMVKTNAEAMARLSEAIDNLNASFADLRQEIRLMRSEMETINRMTGYRMQAEEANRRREERGGN
ncbi:MAG: hypothetical protein H0Z33_16650 [Bacillaceae bacterium]|nr:hypothetical protein [Bacillaceae bacterium]